MASTGPYVPLPVSPAQFAAAVEALPVLGFRGVNVTLPHKEAALRLCADVDRVAAGIGAVNTITVREDGTLYGTNTDAFGFLENLRQGHPTFDASSGPATVLGAGGAARAVVVALLDAGAPEIRLVNRTRKRAEALAKDFGSGCAVSDWRDLPSTLDGVNLLVNATSLGMTGQPSLDVELSRLPVEAVVTDLVYAPLMTGLLSAGQARGNPIVDGLGMLLHQGRPGFKAWFGADPSVTDALRAFVASDL